MRGRTVVLILALAVTLFLLVPLAIVVPMSFSTAISFAFPPPGVWLGYYEEYFSSRSWMRPTVNSFIIGAGTMVVTMAIVIPASFGYVRYRFTGKAFFNLLLMAPLVVPQVVSGLAYYGFLGQLSIGGSRLLGSIPGVIIAHTALAVPVTFLVIAATLKGFDRNLERAAMNAGAGPFRTFFYVTLPVLKPGIMVGALFSFLSSFNEAVVAIFIAGRDASTLPKKMFESIRLDADPVIAVVSSLLIGAVLLGVAMSVILRKRRANGS